MRRLDGNPIITQATDPSVGTNINGPSLIRFPKTAPRNVPEHEVGRGLRARQLREGADAVILAVGKLVGAALDAAELLAEHALAVAVWDVRVVKPLDPEMIAAAARFPLVLTAEDGLRDGGAGTAIADAIQSLVIARQATGLAMPTMAVLGIPCSFLPHGKADQILADLGLDGAGIATEIRRLLARQCQQAG